MICPVSPFADTYCFGAGSQGGGGYQRHRGLSLSFRGSPGASGGSWLSFPPRQDTRSSPFNDNKASLEGQGLASSGWVNIVPLCLQDDCAGVGD